MILIGVDPGLDGAMAVLADGKVVFFDTPTINTKSGKRNKREYNIAEMAQRLRKLDDPDIKVLIAIEKIHAMPKQGVSSMFSMGFGFGIWQGILAAYQIPYTLVPPKIWKNKIVGVGKDKEASRLKAIQLFPKCAEQLKRKKDHNRAEALLIAEYTRQTHQL